MNLPDLARFKQPRRLFWLDGLPLLPSGKIDRARVMRHAACLAPDAEVMMPNQPKDPNEGEGNQTAAKEYDAAATKHAHAGNVEKEAEDARRAIESSENAELVEAEKKGKSRLQEEDPELGK